MEDSFLDSEQYREALKKSWVGSKFTYRSKFDPLTDEEYKLLHDLEEREHS